MVGLCIHHKEGLIESLGQWDLSDDVGDRNVIDIYDEYFGSSLDSLMFHYSINVYKSTYINDISVGCRSVGGSFFVWHAYADKVSKPPRNSEFLFFSYILFVLSNYFL